MKIETTIPDTKTVIDFLTTYRTEIIERSKMSNNDEEREFYMEMAITIGWDLIDLQERLINN